MGALTLHAIDFTRNIRWENLSAAVQHQAKRCLMDTLGAHRSLMGAARHLAHGRRIGGKISLAERPGDW